MFFCRPGTAHRSRPRAIRPRGTRQGGRRRSSPAGVPEGRCPAKPWSNHHPTQTRPLFRGLFSLVFNKWGWLKTKQEGQTAGFGPCFHLPGFHVGTGFLSHGQIAHFSKGVFTMDPNAPPPLVLGTRVETLAEPKLWWITRNGFLQATSVRPSGVPLAYEQDPLWGAPLILSVSQTWLFHSPQPCAEPTPQTA